MSEPQYHNSHPGLSVREVQLLRKNYQHKIRIDEEDRQRRLEATVDDLCKKVDDMTKILSIIYNIFEKHQMLQ